jgi:TatD DNase family protein
MIPEFFDTHAHLNCPDFAAELNEVVERARQAGISRIVAIGTDEQSSRRCIELAEKFPNVYAAVGWHPSDAHRAPEDVRPLLRELASHPRVAALGETGLDHYRLPSKQGQSATLDEPYTRRQAVFFRLHLDVAVELKLNCVIHQRSCFAQTVETFAPFAPDVRGVFHCFSEPVAAMQQIIEMGSFVSFTGIVTFKNAEELRKTVANAPPKRFMLETDAPFLAPVPFRGKRCEPAHVKLIAETVSQTRECSLEELSRLTCDAAKDFFRFES